MPRRSTTVSNLALAVLPLDLALGPRLTVIPEEVFRAKEVFRAREHKGAKFGVSSTQFVLSP